MQEKLSLFVAGVMISLSKVIKKNFTNELEEKSITIQLMTMNYPEHQTNDTDIAAEERKFVKKQIIEKAQKEADLIIENAKHEAEVLRDQIKKEKQAFDAEKKKIMEQAKSDGFAEGVQLGKEKGYQEVNDLIQFAKSIVEEAKVEYKNCVEHSEQTILSLSLKVAEKILHLSLDEKEEIFLPIVKKAIEEVKDYKEVQVYVHPSHYQLLVSKKDEFVPYFHEGQIYIYPDENMSTTDCVIETDGIRIDASLDTQLQELKNRLIEIFIGDEQ